MHSTIHLTDSVPASNLVPLRGQLHRLEHLLRDIEKHIATAVDLCPSDVRILECLLQEGPSPVNNIGEQVLLTSGSMSTAVERLKRRGLVAKQADRMDRRIQLVSLTRDGYQLVQRVNVLHVTYLRDLFAGMAETECSQLNRLLTRLESRARGVKHRATRPATALV